MSGAAVVRVHGPHYRRRKVLETKRRVTDAGCWEWTGAFHRSSGYGQYRTDAGNLLVHRMAYEVLVGPIPDEHQIHHRCGNRLCFNPGHLEALTRADHYDRHYPRCEACGQRLR